MVEKIYEAIMTDNVPKTVGEMEDILAPLQNVGSVEMTEYVKSACRELQLTRGQTSEQFFAIRLSAEAICECMVFKFLVDELMH